MFQINDRPRPIIIAHRGASSLEPGNSLAAFERAVDLGADMVEFDVRRTRDGVMVVHHDERIGGHLIRQISYEAANQLARRTCPPRLQDAIGLLRGRVGLDIELKESGYEEEFLQTVLAMIPRTDFVATSFLDQSVAAIKELDAKVTAGLILGIRRPARDLVTGMGERSRFARLQACRADFMAAHYGLAGPSMLRRATSHGVPVWVWTVNDAKSLHRCIVDPRIQGVVTDVPDLAVRLRNA
jgi:glycerophosphoryl diester phosphodiesterase